MSRIHDCSHGKHEWQASPWTAHLPLVSSHPFSLASYEWTCTYCDLTVDGYTVFHHCKSLGLGINQILEALRDGPPA